jgi:hypothetical protein
MRLDKRVCLGSVAAILLLGNLAFLSFAFLAHLQIIQYVALSLILARLYFFPSARPHTLTWEEIAAAGTLRRSDTEKARYPSKWAVIASANLPTDAVATIGEFYALFDRLLFSGGRNP